VLQAEVLQAEVPQAKVPQAKVPQARNMVEEAMNLSGIGTEEESDSIPTHASSAEVTHPTRFRLLWGISSLQEK